MRDYLAEATEIYKSRQEEEVKRIAKDLEEQHLIDMKVKIQNECPHDNLEIYGGGSFKFCMDCSREWSVF